MKNKVTGLMMVGALALSSVLAYAQEGVAGSWAMSLAGLSMPLVLTQQGETISGTLDTPHGLFTLKGNFADGKLKLSGVVHDGSADISGTLQPDGSLSGTFSMSQMEMPFTAVRSKASEAPPADQVALVRAGVAALGKQWNGSVKAETAELYLPLHKSHNNSGIKQMRDLSYGPDVQQKLDLFVPDQGFNDLSPVFVFLHEGQDKIVANSDQLLYSNVARWIARFGGVGINANFRTSRNAASASGAEDVRLLVQWAQKNVRPYGGDPNAIIVLGNGEGAVRLASYLFNEKSQPEGGPGVAAAILGSGLFASLPANLVDSYQGKAVPLLMWSAELDPVESGVMELKDKLCEKYDRCPAFVELRGHNHVSAVMSIDSVDTSVTDQIIRFYHSAVR